MRYVVFILLSVLCCLTVQASPFDREGEQSTYYPIVLSSKQVAGKDFPEYEFNARETDAQGRIRGTIAIRQNGKAKVYAFTVAGAAGSDEFMPLSVKRKGREEEEAWSVRVRGDILNLQMPGLERPVAMKRIPALTVLTPPKPKKVAPVPAVQPEPIPVEASPAHVAKEAPVPAKKQSAPESSSWTDFAWLGAVGYRAGQALFAVLFIAPLVLAWKRGSRFTLPVTIASLVGVLTVCFGYEGSFWVAYVVSCVVLAVLACIPAKKQVCHVHAIPMQERAPIVRVRIGDDETEYLDDHNVLSVSTNTVLSHVRDEIERCGRDKLKAILHIGIEAYIDQAVQHIGEDWYELAEEDEARLAGDPQEIVPEILHLMENRCHSLLKFYRDHDYNPTILFTIMQEIDNLRQEQGIPSAESSSRKRKYTIKGYND